MNEVSTNPDEQPGEEEIDVTDTPFLRELATRFPTHARAAQQWRPQFLKAFSMTPAATVACKAAHVSLKTYLAHREMDEVFAKACLLAELHARDMLLHSAWQDAVEGYEKPVYQGGKMVGTIIERSDAMRAMLLKGYIPERFERAKEVQLTGSVGMPVLSAEEIANIVRKMNPALLGELGPNEAIDQASLPPNAPLTR